MRAHSNANGHDDNNSNNNDDCDDAACGVLGYKSIARLAMFDDDYRATSDDNDNDVDFMPFCHFECCQNCTK